MSDKERIEALEKRLLLLEELVNDLSKNLVEVLITGLEKKK
jgi:uncharacterized coiled-coil protein SlyX